MKRNQDCMGYDACARIYATRRNKKINEWKPVSHNQWLRYDPIDDCYRHKHHNTITVSVYRDKYVINTGGWDTSTTWAKIHQFAKVRFSGPPTKAFHGSKFVVWDGHEGLCYTEFYDGIEVNYDGVPLNPQPVQIRRARPGARAEFYALAKRVRDALAVRMLVGEFENVDDIKPQNGDFLLNLVRMVAARSDGLFKEFLPREYVIALFAQRERTTFGKPRRTHDWNGNPFDPPKRTSAKQRLQSNLNVALHEWEHMNFGAELYETYNRSYT